MNPVLVAAVVDRLLSLCARKGISPAVALREARVNPGYLSNLKSGKSKNPSLVKFARIADVLGVPLAELLTGKSEAEALRPFARAAEHYPSEMPDGWIIARELTIGDLRRARDAFAKMETHQ